MLSTKKYRETLTVLLAGGLGSGRHPTTGKLYSKDHIFWQSMLKNPELVDGAVRVNGILHIPAGGERKIGTTDISYEHDRNSLKLKVIIDKLKNKPGFDNVQIVRLADFPGRTWNGDHPSHLGQIFSYPREKNYTVAWGSQAHIVQLKNKFASGDHIWLGIAHGYKNVVDTSASVAAGGPGSGRKKSFTVVSNRAKGRLEIHRSGCSHLGKINLKEPKQYTNHTLQQVINKNTEIGDDPDYLYISPCTRKDMSSGGPGSGWTKENGHVGTQKENANHLTEHLQGLSKNPLPAFVKKAAKSLESAGLDKRYFENRQMSKFRTADHLAIHPLAIANYNEAKRMLEFRNDAGKDDVTHELAHHLDLTFVRKPDAQDGDKVTINAKVAAKVVSDYTKEWQAAKDNLTEELGHRFRFSNDYQKMESKLGLVKNLPTLYAADGPKEWFAESLSQYCKGGQYRDRLERIAPLTAAAVKTVLTGRIFS